MDVLVVGRRRDARGATGRWRCRRDREPTAVGGAAGAAPCVGCEAWWVGHARLRWVGAPQQVGCRRGRTDRVQGVVQRVARAGRPAAAAGVRITLIAKGLWWSGAAATGACAGHLVAVRVDALGADAVQRIVRAAVRRREVGRQDRGLGRLAAVHGDDDRDPFVVVGGRAVGSGRAGLAARRITGPGDEVVRRPGDATGGPWSDRGDGAAAHGRGAAIEGVGAAVYDKRLERARSPLAVVRLIGRSGSVRVGWTRARQTRASVGSAYVRVAVGVGRPRRRRAGQRDLAIWQRLDSLELEGGAVGEHRLALGGERQRLRGLEHVERCEDPDQQDHRRRDDLDQREPMLAAHHAPASWFGRKVPVLSTVRCFRPPWVRSPLAGTSTWTWMNVGWPETVPS